MNDATMRHLNQLNRNDTSTTQPVVVATIVALAVTLVSLDGYTLDDFYLARPGMHDVQLDLLLDYRNNIAMYPTFQEYFRKYQPPLLAVWGKNDPFFLPPGAEAFKRDIPAAVVEFVDTGHFALETHHDQIATAINNFLSRREAASLA